MILELGLVPKCNTWYQNTQAKQMTTNKQCALQKQSNISIELYYQHHITAKTGSQEVHHKAVIW